MTSMLGTVTGLRRYPVKSMLGEDLTESGVSRAGLAGDRGLALLHQTTGRVVSAKNPRLWRAMLTLTATLTGEAVKITFPEGKIAWSTDADVDDVLSEFLGQLVTLTATPPEGAAMEHADPDTVNEQGVTADAATTLVKINAGAPEGTFFNFAPVHLITTATLDRIAGLHPDGGPVSLLRYRPNVVIGTPDQRGFTENDWLGRELAIGDELVVRVVARTPRCAVPTLPHGTTAARDPEALRIVARHNRVSARAGDASPQPCAGVYAEVVRPGVIGTGDAVSLRTPLRALAEPPVQCQHLPGQFWHRAGHRDAGQHVGDPQDVYRGRAHAKLLIPGGGLLGGCGVHDAAEPGPAVRRRTHRAVLPRRIHGGGGALGRNQVQRRPAGQRDLWVPGRVAGTPLPVVLLRQHDAVGRDEHRAERLVAVVDRLGRQRHASPQVDKVSVRHVRHVAAFTVARACHACSG
jgi:uncharacterized protein YcbX